MNITGLWQALNYRCSALNTEVSLNHQWHHFTHSHSTVIFNVSVWGVKTKATRPASYWFLILWPPLWACWCLQAAAAGESPARTLFITQQQTCMIKSPTPHSLIQMQNMISFLLISPPCTVITGENRWEQFQAWCVFVYGCRREEWVRTAGQRVTQPGKRRGLLRDEARKLPSYNLRLCHRVHSIFFVFALEKLFILLVFISTLAWRWCQVTVSTETKELCDMIWAALPAS